MFIYIVLFISYNIEIDIPNIEEVNLPYSLRYVYSSYVSSNSYSIIIISRYPLFILFYYS